MFLQLCVPLGTFLSSWAYIGVALTSIGFVTSSLEAKDGVRTWTSAEDGRQIDARFFRLSDGQVTLIREGQKIHLPLQLLSDKDRKWIEEHERIRALANQDFSRVRLSSSRSSGGTYRLYINGVDQGTTSTTVTRRYLEVPSSLEGVLIIKRHILPEFQINLPFKEHFELRKVVLQASEELNFGSDVETRGPRYTELAQEISSARERLKPAIAVEPRTWKPEITGWGPTGDARLMDGDQLQQLSEGMSKIGEGKASLQELAESKELLRELVRNHRAAYDEGRVWGIGFKGGGSPYQILNPARELVAEEK